MATFEEILAELAETEGGEEKVDVIKSRLHKVNTESQSLRKRMRAYETDAKKYIDLVEKLTESDIDLDGDIIEQVSSLNDTKTKSTKLEKTVADLMKKFEASESKNQVLEKKGKIANIRSKLSKNFNEKIYNPQITLDYRINNGDFYLNEDDRLVFKHGDEEVTENVFDAYIKAFPDEVKLNHKPGPGGKPFNSEQRSGSYSEEQLKSMSVEDYEALTPEQQTEVQNSVNSIAK